MKQAFRRSSRSTRGGIVAVVVLAVAAFARAALAGGYTADERIAYVQRALTALVALGEARDRLEVELSNAARQKCGGSGSQPPRLPCLLEQAEKLCASSRYGDAATCAVAADVILVNLRSAGELVDEPTRVRLVRSAADYHDALLAELRKRYAVLAAELVIEDPEASSAPPVSATAVDRFCVRRDYRPKPPRCDAPSATCVPSLSWQRCTAALAWFAVTASPSTSSPAKERTP